MSLKIYEIGFFYICITRIYKKNIDIPYSYVHCSIKKCIFFSCCVFFRYTNLFQRKLTEKKTKKKFIRNKLFIV